MAPNIILHKKFKHQINELCYFKGRVIALVFVVYVQNFTFKKIISVSLNSNQFCLITWIINAIWKFPSFLSKCKAKLQMIKWENSLFHLCKTWVFFFKVQNIYYFNITILPSCVKNHIMFMNSTLRFPSYQITFFTGKYNSVLYFEVSEL